MLVVVVVTRGVFSRKGIKTATGRTNPNQEASLGLLGRGILLLLLLLHGSHLSVAISDTGIACLRRLLLQLRRFDVAISNLVVLFGGAHS